MRRAVRALAVIVVTCASVVLLSHTVLSNTPFGEAVRGASDDAANAAANAALDASGVKERVDQALRDNVSTIASATGLSEAQVEQAIDGLDVTSWSVTALPADAVASNGASGTYDGMSASVTTYEDPSYVTVEVGGQELTLSVPESAQQYARLLSYL